MKHMTKRMLSLLLAIITVFSLGAVAFADTGNTTSGENNSENTGNTYEYDIDVDQSSIELYSGQSKTVNYYISGDLTDTTSVKAESDDNSIIEAVTSGSTAVTITADSSINQTVTATVTLTLMVNSKEVDTCSVKVTAHKDEVESIDIKADGSSVTSISVDRWRSATLTATATMKSGATTNAVTWSSSDTSVASVNGGSNGTTVTGNNAGVAIITAKAGNGISSQVTVLVGESSATLSNITSSTGSELTVGQTSTLSVTASPNDFSSYITWTSNKPPIATVTGSGSSCTVKAIAQGDVTITASLGEKTVTYNIAVKPLAMTGITLTPTSLTLNKGSTYALSVKPVPTTVSSDDYTVAWKTSNSSVATVDSNGTVKAVGSGTATITATATVTSTGTTFSKTCTVKVGGTTNIEIYLDSKDDYVFSSKNTEDNVSAYSTISSAIRSAAGTSSSSPYSYIEFGTPTSGSSSVGTLYANSSNRSLSYYSSYSYSSSSTSSVYKLYFSPKKTGTYSIPYYAYDAYGALLTSGYLYIVVGDNDVTVTVNLDDSDAYEFSEATKKDKTSAAEAIEDAIYDAVGENYYYITFGSAPSSTMGTLYADSDKTTIRSNSTEFYRTGTSSSKYYTDELYFVPNKNGTYSREFTAYDKYDDELVTGTLELVVGNGGNTITVNLDDDDPYEFSDDTKKDKTSAADAIEDAVYEDYGSNYSYLIFDTVSTSSSAVGTLFADSDETAIKTTTKYYRTGSSLSNYYVDDLYFVPKKNGTYSRDFTAYSSTGKEIYSGTLELVVGNGGASSDIDIYFNTTTGSTITFGEDVFEDWFQAQKGSSYKLAYVTFDDYEEDYGTFKHSTSTFTPGNDVNYYTDGYTGSTGTSAKYLKNVKFTAESSYGFEAVDFTCYGGTTASKANVSASGTLYIYATKGSVKNITYTVKYGSAQDLDEDDFLDTYKTAMSTTSSTAKYYIQLLETPAKGTLYYNYTSSTKPGTKITTSNFDDYEFYVNGSSLYDSVEDLTYIPAASLTGTGSTSVRYLAYSTSGDPLYVGTIVFDYGTASTSMTCASDGYTFKLTDFYSATDSDRVVSLTFKQPTSGALYLNAKNGSGTLLTSTTKLYTISSASGSYPITALTYIPKAGASGNVSISYTATTASGKSSSGTVTIAVTSKTASSQFTDVTASGVGSWAADAVDFAYKWGLVNGTGTYTFDPNGTMSRAMMVAVLYRAAGSPTVTGSCPFKDVSSSAYYYDAVIWANKNGIVTGTSSTTFNPDGAVTREQVATFLYRYAKYKGTSTTNTGSLSAYTDQSNVSSYAKDAMTWAVTNGYITSTSTTAKVLTPAGNASRAQVAVMLHRFLTY